MGSKAIKFRKKEVMDAIKGSEGLLKNVAKKLGVNVATAKRVIDSNLEYQDEMARQIAIMEDMARDTIQEALMAGDLNTAKWYLEYQSRKGYVGDVQKVQVSFVEDL